jgi:hypothetical protein
MLSFRHLRRPVALVAGLVATGALAAFGSAPALAVTVTPIWSSGATIQNQLQSDVLIKDWTYGSNVTWTSTSAGDAFAEFGNVTGSLDLTQDPTADKATGGPYLDGYVAVDSAPTGPYTTSKTNLYEAKAAAVAAGDNSDAYEVTVPVAQTGIEIPLSLPAKLTVSGQILLTNKLLAELFAGTVPAAGGYAANTWGALLTLAGASFTDTGGGSATIQVELRKNGAGATLVLKQYLNAVDKLGGWTDWTSIPIDENAYTQAEGEWPTGATVLPATGGNSSDPAEATAVWNTPGTVGYITTGDGYTQGFKATETTGGDSQEVLYALVQDNGVSGTPIYANPEGTTDGNVYIGSNININGSGGVGSWTVPSNLKNGTWSPTYASDPSVYTDAGASNTTAYYPIVSVLYDLGWYDYTGLQYTNVLNSGYTAQQFLKFATGSTGQSDIDESAYYLAELPSAILSSAQTAASDVSAGTP